LVVTNAESIEAALDFIENHRDDMYHRFESDKNSNDNPDSLLSISIHNELNVCCSRCGFKKRDHIIDEEGNAILTVDDDIKPSPLDGLETLIEQRQIKLIAGEDLAMRREMKVQSEAVGILEKAMTIADTTGSSPETTGPTAKCHICLDDVPLSMFHEAPCGHNYCKTCLQSHYRVKTKDGDVLKVSCIDPDCERLIEPDEILTFLTDPDLKAKFLKFREEKLAMLTPNLRFCCKPDCPGKMTGSRIQRKLTCPVCSTQICFNCSQPWHGYFVGCNQNVDIGFSKWALNKDVQKCPKCRMGIEKDDGCNHMTCSSCKYEFCWICKGPYTDSHFEFWNIFGCPGAQYTPRFCRCPSCFPRWMNRIIIIMCFMGIVVPLCVVAGTLWVVLLCVVFCVRCDFKCDLDPCDIF